ncbi:unnamed protein product [Meloidogyne enterolobii]|uniref:Uncharacterized protein n=1 Tax=Meloidogyne enterolobii TaxID=390850 RepID=A0ACB1ARQ9_MELEN
MPEQKIFSRFSNIDFELFVYLFYCVLIFLFVYLFNFVFRVIKPKFLEVFRKILKTNCRYWFLPVLVHLIAGTGSTCCLLKVLKNF